MTRTRLILFVLFSVLLVSACNTIEGIGKDIKSAGGSIEGAGKNGKN